MAEFEILYRTIIEENMLFFRNFKQKMGTNRPENDVFIEIHPIFDRKRQFFSNLVLFDGKLIFRIKFIYLETIKHHKFLSKITDKSQFSWS